MYTPILYGGVPSTTWTTPSNMTGVEFDPRILLQGFYLYLSLFIYIYIKSFFPSFFLPLYIFLSFSIFFFFFFLSLMYMQGNINQEEYPLSKYFCTLVVKNNAMWRDKIQFHIQARQNITLNLAPSTTYFFEISCPDDIAGIITGYIILLSFFISPL